MLQQGCPPNASPKSCHCESLCKEGHSEPNCRLNCVGQKRGTKACWEERYSATRGHREVYSQERKDGTPQSGMTPPKPRWPLARTSLIPVCRTGFSITRALKDRTLRSTFRPMLGAFTGGTSSPPISIYLGITKAQPHECPRSGTHILEAVTNTASRCPRLSRHLIAPIGQTCQEDMQRIPPQYPWQRTVLAHSQSEATHGS